MAGAYRRPDAATKTAAVLLVPSFFCALHAGLGWHVLIDLGSLKLFVQEMLGGTAIGLFDDDFPDDAAARGKFRRHPHHQQPLRNRQRHAAVSQMYITVKFVITGDANDYGRQMLQFFSTEAVDERYHDAGDERHQE